MVEKHYGHLAPDAVAEPVKKFPTRMLTVPKSQRKMMITRSEYQGWRQPGVPLPSNIKLVKG
jgi:hypothetical protein